MNHDIHPGKLKRKSKRGLSSSVVDLPAASHHSNSGNLLGETFFEADPISTTPFSDTPSETPSDVAKKIIDVSPQESKVELSAPISPLDMLKSDEESQFEQFAESEPEPRKVIKVDAVPESGRLDSTQMHTSASSQTLSSVRRKTLKPKSDAETEDSASDDIPKINTLIQQSQSIQQKCLDTLTKMQNTNALNERRYALYITMAMIVFMVVIIIGVYVGVNMRNTAKDNEYKLKSDAYKSLIESKQVIEKELERDQEGLKAAFEVYQLIENGSFKEAVDRFVEIRDKLTHPAETALLEQRIDDIRWQLAENAYNDGYSKYNVSNYEQARDAFFESLAFKENTSYTPRLYYYLAMSLFQLNDYEGARRYFAMINTSELNSEMDANTKYYWGISAEKIGDESEAFEQYDSFLKKYRYHRLADEVVKKRARVESARPGR